MKNELLPIDWHTSAIPRRPTRSGERESALAEALERMGVVIRGALSGRPISEERSLSQLTDETKAAAASAKQSKESHAALFGVLFVVLAFADAVGNAIGLPTITSLLFHQLMPDHGAWAYTVCWACTLLLWAGGFFLLKRSPWKFWIRRALINSLPRVLGGDEPATRVKSVVNVAGLGCTLSLVIAGLALTPSPGLLWVAGIVLVPVIWLNLKAIVPILLVRDRGSRRGLMLAIAIQWLIGFFVGSDLAVAAQGMPEHPLHTFMRWQLGSAYFGIVAIAGALFASWHERVTYVISMNGQSDRLPMATHLYALVGVPTPETWLRFEGPATYVVLARRPGEGAYRVQPPTQPLLLNEAEVSVVDLTGLAQIKLEYPPGIAAGAELIRLKLPGSTSLAKRLGPQVLSSEGVEFLEKIAQPQFRTLVGHVAADALQSPLYAMRDEWGRFDLEIERLTTELVAVRSVPNWTGQTRRTDSVQELMGSLRGLEAKIHSMRNRVDEVSNHFGRASIDRRWKERFAVLLRQRLAETYQSALSEEALEEVSAFLHPLQDADPVRLTTDAKLTEEMELMLRGPQELERKLQALLEEVARMRHDLMAARDNLSHEAWMKFLDALPAALASSRAVARQYAECLQGALSRNMDGNSPAAWVLGAPSSDGGRLSGAKPGDAAGDSLAGAPRIVTRRDQVTTDQDDSPEDGSRIDD